MEKYFINLYIKKIISFLYSLHIMSESTERTGLIIIKTHVLW